MTTVFPKVRAKTAGAGLSPHGKTNNTLSCEMAFDAFPKGKGAQQTSHWGWNHGGKYCSIIINSFFLLLFFLLELADSVVYYSFHHSKTNTEGVFLWQRLDYWVTRRLSDQDSDWQVLWLVGWEADWSAVSLITPLIERFATWPTGLFWLSHFKKKKM